jgi:hypothetical protein
MAGEWTLIRSTLPTAAPLCALDCDATTNAAAIAKLVLIFIVTASRR